MTTTVTAAPAEITLEAHHCANRRSYLVTFTGPDAETQALTFVTERGMTHAFFELPEKPVDETYGDLLNRLYPTCDHGMSAHLCADPINHYPADR